jgi:hypothetical protein
MVTAYRQRVDTFPSDPDLRHLADLLDLLPGPDDRDFWERVAGKGSPPNPLHYTDYVIKNVAVHMAVLRTPTPQPRGVEQLAQYLLMFFGGDHPRLRDLLSRRVTHFAVKGDAVGRWWLDDLTATCWRLYVRYKSGERLMEWPVDFHAWLTEQKQDAAED